MFWGDTALRNNVIFLFLFFVFLSCSTKYKEYGGNVSFYSEFPQKKELKGDKDYPMVIEKNETV